MARSLWIVVVLGRERVRDFRDCVDSTESGKRDG